MNGRQGWEEQSANWVRFARAPGHDAYWYYRNAFFDEIVPPPGLMTLEVGSGEGRVARDLHSRGHRTVALDGSMTLVRSATVLDPVRRYILGDAVALPLADGSIDVAVAYNSLMDFDDLSGAVSEVSRVLSDDGTFCICITHPIEYSGGFDSENADAPYTLRDSYFGVRRFDQTVTRDGITMRFRGWSRPMEDYFSALFAAGFVVDELREPVPSTDEGRYARWHRYPMFLHVRAAKRA